MKKKLTRVIRKHGRWYIAYIREIPGVNTQGRSRRSARRNLEEALTLIIETREIYLSSSAHSVPAAVKSSPYFSKYSCKNSTVE
jgi:predicted RNase H-like HicB family nuclease